MITERNYLEVYPYEKWSDKVCLKNIEILAKIENYI